MAVKTLVVPICTSFFLRIVVVFVQAKSAFHLSGVVNWLTPQKQILCSQVYKAAHITYKVVTTSTPSCVNDLLVVHIPARPTRLSSTCQLQVPCVTRSDFARRSFCFVSPTGWNSLPSDVQSIVRHKQLSSQY